MPANAFNVPCGRHAIIFVFAIARSVCFETNDQHTTTKSNHKIESDVSDDVRRAVKEGDLQRTIRSCGWVKTNERVSCYKADNDDHLETVCQCFEDGCNGAAAATTSLAAAGAAVVALVASAALLQR